nr:hypothetical protein [Tanacetum cinerariifolium]
MLMLEMNMIEQKIALLEATTTVTNVPELTPDYLKEVKQEPKYYYVIYKGPHSGIHTDWGVTKAFCNNDRVTCKKFKSEESARISLATYSQEGLDQKPVLLRLKIQKIKEEHRDQRFKITEDKDQDIFKPPMKFEEFRLIWNKARAACPEDFLHEKFFTTYKVTKSLYNFVEGADPKLIQQAFEAGLKNNIYPSHNLQELRHFPQPVVDSIKNFRKKVLKAKDDPIYIKIISSVPDWQQEDGYKSYHFLEIGLAKSKKEIS